MATGVAGIPDEHLQPFEGRKAAGEIPDPTVFLREVLLDSATSNGVSGIKVMFDHLEVLGRKLFPDESAEEGVFRVYRMFREAVPDFRLVSLRRRDLLDQSISFQVAVQTGLWHSTNMRPFMITGERPEKEPAFDYAAITEGVYRLNEEGEKWERLFNASSSPVRRYIYEDAVRRYEKTIKELLNFVAAREAGQATIPPPPLKKMSSERNRAWKEQFLSLAREKDDPVLELVLPHHEKVVHIRKDAAPAVGKTNPNRQTQNQPRGGPIQEHEKDP